MRIALLTDSDAFAGTERHMLDLAGALRSAPGDGAANVVIACPQPSPLASAAETKGVNVLPIPKSPGLVDLPAARLLRRLLRAGEIDVIHAHNGRTALAAALAVRLAGRGRSVFTQHFLDPCRTTRRGPKAMLSRLAHHWVDRHTHGHIAISNAVRQGMINRREAAPDAIDVVFNGISPTAVAKLTPPDVLRQQLRIPSDAVLIVCASRLEPEKDVTTLIEAMALLNALPAVQLLVAGSGAQEASLRKKINDWGLSDCVSLLGFRNDVMSLIAAGDIFVLPSKVEGFGLVLPEAMSLAKPVVATAAGGPLEVVVDNVTGLLVPPSNPAALAAALQRLIEDPALRAEMGRRGLERFNQRFTADRMAAETLNVYRRVLGLPAASPVAPLAELTAHVA